MKVSQECKRCKHKKDCVNVNKFRDGDYVQVREGSDLDERFTESGKPKAKGFVFDVPKGLTKAAEWKYTVKFPGIGKDGVIESDLEYATA